MSFKKTILGRILKGVAKVALPVVGIVTGLGAVGGIAKGVGALAGVGAVLKGGKKVIDKVGGAAANLVTGTTKEERVQVRKQKAITKAAVDKLEQVDRLVKAGASPADARLQVGLSEEELPKLEGESTKAGLMDYVKSNPVLAGVGALALVFLLPKLLKRKR